MTTEVATLVDSNVLLDVARDDPVWAGWSEEALAQAADTGPLLINPIIYAELSPGFARIEDLDAAVTVFERDPLPWDAGYLAGQSFLRYRGLGAKSVHPFPTFTSAHTRQSRGCLC